MYADLKIKFYRVFLCTKMFNARKKIGAFFLSTPCTSYNTLIYNYTSLWSICIVYHSDRKSLLSIVTSVYNHHFFKISYMPKRCFLVLFVLDFRVFASRWTSLRLVFLQMISQWHFPT